MSLISFGNVYRTKNNSIKDVYLATRHVNCIKAFSGEKILTKDGREIFQEVTPSTPAIVFADGKNKGINYILTGKEAKLARCAWAQIMQTYMVVSELKKLDDDNITISEGPISPSEAYDMQMMGIVDNSKDAEDIEIDLKGYVPKFKFLA